MDGDFDFLKNVCRCLGEEAAIFVEVEGEYDGEVEVSLSGGGGGTRSVEVDGNDSLLIEVGLLGIEMKLRVYWTI